MSNQKIYIIRKETNKNRFNGKIRKYCRAMGLIILLMKSMLWYL